MVAEKTKRMPKGVGKRIVETLKTQEAKADFDETIEEEPEEVEQLTVEVEEEAQEVEEFECEPVDEDGDDVVDNFTCATKNQRNSKGSDIDTLLNLISSLPSGVTKQTGAVIIRQTMEAMGIPMNDVLSNAQSVQEGLENSIRDNVNVIEEYRTKIKILEQEIQKFRKKAHELEDIISLFILSDDKNPA